MANGVMMILSPAKTLDLSPLIPTSRLVTLQATPPSCDASKTRRVAESMKKRSKLQLQKLLSISPKLAETAHQYWTDFQIDGTSSSPATGTKPCLFSFSGAAYQGLQATSLNAKSVSYLQENLRIVDPLYGLLRPLDALQPYRLEMATKGVLDGKDESKIKLADWWKASVTTMLRDELNKNAEETSTKEQNTTLLLNLASDEYSAAIDTSALPLHTCYVKVVFQDGGRVISVHAKRARGLMVRYAAERNVTTLGEIQEFDEEGYQFVPGKSSDTILVFNRASNPNAKKRSTASKPSNKTKKARA